MGLGDENSPRKTLNGLFGYIGVARRCTGPIYGEKLQVHPQAERAPTRQLQESNVLRKLGRFGWWE